MKFYIKQKVFTLGEKFTVKNEFGEDVYFVEGSFFTFPKNFKITNVFGETVCEIERQMFRLFGHYNIMTSSKTITLKREFSFFRANYSILGIDWHLQGDFFDHNYQVLSGSSPVLSLSKHWFTWGDSYELDIPDHEDEVLALAIAICIDEEIERDQSSHN
ncbi:LURP-one-related/scramblase family protein [Erysipelothrix urinaevulpis]|uniref:LURP-one-related/scramblase family protein n=1 Tax=Erysipelothrix urinaevulpis TaxID=2683717 RepID=UPI001359B44F|nr:LURP-one-related family protein [Erysipelothrix urinaevulpis]